MRIGMINKSYTPAKSNAIVKSQTFSYIYTVWLVITLLFAASDVDFKVIFGNTLEYSNLFCLVKVSHSVVH